MKSGRLLGFRFHSANDRLVRTVLGLGFAVGAKNIKKRKLQVFRESDTFDERRKKKRVRTLFPVPRPALEGGPAVASRLPSSLIRAPISVLTPFRLRHKSRQAER